MNSPVLIFCQLLIYADGIDGKQARRTATSSPLGELFDHGLDSWSASYFMFNVYSVFGREQVPGTPIKFIGDMQVLKNIFKENKTNKRVDNLPLNKWALGNLALHKWPLDKWAPGQMGIGQMVP